MSDKDDKLSDAEISGLARRLFGPEEDWDDAAVEFVLRLQGINPADRGEEIAYGTRLILKVIERRKKQGKNVPRELLTILQKLTAERDREPEIKKAQAQLEKALRAGAGGGQEVARNFRGKEKLSAKDEEILNELEAKLSRKKSD